MILDRKKWRIDLTEWWPEIYYYAYAVAKINLDTIRPDGRPLIDGKIVTGKPFESIHEGWRGEYAIAEALGLPPIMAREVHTNHDRRGYDGWFRHWKYDAKYTRYPTGHLIVQDWMNCKAEILILAVQDSTERDWPQFVRIAGWTTLKYFKANFKTKVFNEDYGASGTAPCLPQKELRPFDTIFDKVPVGDPKCDFCGRTETIEWAGPWVCYECALESFKGSKMDRQLWQSLHATGCIGPRKVHPNEKHEPPVIPEEVRARYGRALDAARPGDSKGTD